MLFKIVLDAPFSLAKLEDAKWIGLEETTNKTNDGFAYYLFR